ncbi:hypothetical protein HK102_013108 [Quaeritorhiza haematococci]|nr:hypothetical protein HK102_013108 [Quaeritorhiza haematococci]
MGLISFLAWASLITAVTAIPPPNASPIATPTSTVSATPTPSPTGTVVELPDVHFTYITYGGSGCPQGSVSINYNQDSTAFTLLFDSFIAQAGPGIAAALRRRNCQLNLQLYVPEGFQYSIATIDYRGYVQLDPKVKSFLSTTYYFQGDFSSDTFSYQFKGPEELDYHIREEAHMATLEWSPCGGNANLNINTQVRVDNSKAKNSTGIMTTDSIDGKVEQIFRLKFQECVIPDGPIGIPEEKRRL